MKNLAIISMRKIWFSISASLCALSILSILSFGFNLGIDFTGGSEVEYSFANGVSKEELLEVVEPIAEQNGLGQPIIQSTGFGSYIIRTKQMPDKVRTILKSRLVEHFDEVTENYSESIGPVLGTNLKKNSFKALSFAIVFIILYIAFAFRTIPKTLSSWRFGMTAIVALVHDVLISVGIFTALGYFMAVEIDSLFITALLTIMGFSVHDTIVIFDRLRENVQKNPEADFETIANTSINQTLMRSINTSLTTLVTLSMMFFLGGESIKWFILALLVGIIAGTYSSIFLAAPLLVTWHKRKKIEQKEEPAIVE